MKAHFHNQEAALLQTTSKKTFLSILLISTILAFSYTNAFAKNALTKSDLAGCQTIKVQYIKNGYIESDSIDEYTLNLTQEESIAKALNITLGSQYEFQKEKTNCQISINLSK